MECFFLLVLRVECVCVFSWVVFIHCFCFFSVVLRVFSVFCEREKVARVAWNQKSNRKIKTEQGLFTVSCFGLLGCVLIQLLFHCTRRFYFLFVRFWQVTFHLCFCVLCAKQLFFSLRLILNSVACLAAFARNSFIFLKTNQTLLISCDFRLFLLLFVLFYWNQFALVRRAIVFWGLCEFVSVCVCVFWDVEIDLSLWKQGFGNRWPWTEISTENEPS